MTHVCPSVCKHLGRGTLIGWYPNRDWGYTDGGTLTGGTPGTPTSQDGGHPNGGYPGYPPARMGDTPTREYPGYPPSQDGGTLGTPQSQDGGLPGGYAHRGVNPPSHNGGYPDGGYPGWGKYPKGVP